MKWFSLFLLALPLTAHAEVMDKEPSLVLISITGVVACFGSFLAARHRPLFLLVVLPLAGVWFGADLAETTDQFIGPAMRAEAGQARLLVPWLAIAGVFLSTVGGLWLRRMRA